MGRINTLLSLDGESQFKRALHDINNNLKTLGKEFSALTSDLSGMTNKMDLATRTSDNLKNQIDFLTRKHDLLTAAVQRAEAEVLKNKDALKKAELNYAAVGQQVDLLEKELKMAEQAFGKNDSTTKKLAAELSRMKDVQKQAASEVNKAQNAVNKSVDTVHKYSQQLADNDTQLHKTETEQRRLNQTTDETTKKVEKETTSFINLGAALKNVAVKAGELTAAFAKAEFKTITGTFQAVNRELELGFQGLQKYTEAFAAATAAVGAFAISNGTNFEASMSKVEAYSGVSAEEMQQLSAAAKEMGATTSKTASEAADALGYLALNGYKTEEMLNSLKPIVKASEAGGMSLASVADLVANSLTSYGKGAAEAEEFLNVLTATQSNSSANLEQLLTTYKELSGTFKILDVDFNESATLLGLVANRGLKGAEAGTALNSVMLRLLGTNKKANTALSEFGITAWDDNGNFKGLTATLNEINAKMAEMTDKEKVYFESQISGVLRFQDFQKLLSAAADTEKYNSLYDINKNASGNNTLYKTAEVMMDNLKGKLTLAKSATEALGISIFETFSDRAVTNVKRFTQWINILNEGVQNGDVIGAFNEIGKFMSGALSRTISELTHKLPDTLNIFNSFILGAADLLIRAMREGKNKIIPKLVRGARDLVSGMIERLPEFTSELLDGAVIMFTGIVNALDKIADKLVEKLPELVKTIGDVLTGDEAANIFETGFEVLMKLLSGITENLPTIMEYAKKLLINICDGIKKHAGELIDGAVAIIGAIADFISDDQVLDALLDTGGVILEKLVTALVDDGVLAKLVEAAFSILERLSRYLYENCEEIFANWIPDIINTLKDQICTSENDAKLQNAGNYLGVAIVKGILAVFKGGLKLGVQIGASGVGLTLASEYGLEGAQRDAFAATFSGLVTGTLYGEETESQKTAKAVRDAERAAKEQHLALETATYEQYAQGYNFQSINDEGTVASFTNEKGQVHLVNLYNPVFNNAGDVEQIAESLASYNAAAVVGGGKY